MNQDPQEFYVGYQAQAPSALAAWLRKRVLVLVAIPILLALVLVVTQNAFAPSSFEFGEVRDFEGWVAESPYPVLVVDRPGDVREGPKSRYYLVQFGKYGAAESVAGLHGQRVRLSGTLIYRDDQTMIELSGEKIEVLPDAAGLRQVSESLGPVELEGEIVDSKCFLGVMNPGEAKTHKACATRCVAGGIPPLLVTRSSDGLRYYLLTGAEGVAINQAVLDFIAEPVRVRGLWKRIDDLDVLEIDPQTIELI